MLRIAYSSVSTVSKSATFNSGRPHTGHSPNDPMHIFPGRTCCPAVKKKIEFQHFPPNRRLIDSLEFLFPACNKAPPYLMLYCKPGIKKKPRRLTRSLADVLFFYYFNRSRTCYFKDPIRMNYTNTQAQVPAYNHICETHTRTDKQQAIQANTQGWANTQYGVQ
jgi:hypothetical protein